MGRRLANRILSIGVLALAAVSGVPAVTLIYAK